MGNEINIKDYVNKNTVRYGIGELDEISSSKIQEQLIQIETFLQLVCKKQRQLSEQIKQLSKLSISSVSSGAKVPRSQINLNVNTLKIYVEKRINEIKKEDILKTYSYERLKTEKRELDSYIDGLRKQLVDTIEMNLHIEQLEAENNRLISLIDDRQKDIQKLETENDKLRKEKSDRRIVTMKKK